MDFGTGSLALGPGRFPGAARGMAEIGAAAEITGSAIYRHFESKSALPEEDRRRLRRKQRLYVEEWFTC